MDERVKERLLSTNVRYIPSPDMAAVLSMGFKPAISDLFWIEALNYYGTQVHEKTFDYRYLDAYVDVILNLDELFAYFYNWSSTVYIYNGLPISVEGVKKAIDVANRGIINLADRGRYDRVLTQKAAYNYALDASYYPPSIEYFKLLGRSFQDQRDMLLIAATYARYSGDYDLEHTLREEYLAYIAFETLEQTELEQAYRLVISSALVAKSTQFVEELRLGLEKDPTLRKLVSERLKEKPVNVNPNAYKRFKVETSVGKSKVVKLLSTTTQKNWIPPELNTLFYAYSFREPVRSNP